MANDRSDFAIPHSTSPSSAKLLYADRFIKDDTYHVQRQEGTADWLLILTVRGNGMIRQTNPSQTISCRAGNATLLPPGTEHDYGTANKATWDFYWAHFLPPRHWEHWFRHVHMPQRIQSVYPTSTETSSRMQERFEQLRLENQRTGLIHDALAVNALEEIVLLIVQHLRQTDRYLDGRVTTVQQYLADHLDEHISIENCARLVHLSASRLSHIYKAETGESIMQTLNTYRMQKAARLLEFSSLPVQEIAARVGFRSAFYFTRQFTTYYGKNPSTYRRAIHRR